ncbi:MAG: hypothetical protein CM15mP74_14470 [Halieaceae bacterium]|nr:MAG: hypothetical protein CM15mP74_14470 [Halieaceae bacterium]
MAWRLPVTGTIRFTFTFSRSAGQIVALIEGFDTALANHALWGECEPLIPDEGQRFPTWLTSRVRDAVLTCLTIRASMNRFEI